MKGRYGDTSWSASDCSYSGVLILVKRPDCRRICAAHRRATGPEDGLLSPNPNAPSCRMRRPSVSTQPRATADSPTNGPATDSTTCSAEAGGRVSSTVLIGCLSSPSGAGQRPPRSFASRTSFSAAPLFRRPLAGLIFRHAIPCRRHQTPTVLAKQRPACQAENIVSGQSERRAIPDQALLYGQLGRQW